MNEMRVAADAVVFGYDGDMHLLVVERKYEPFKNALALPGGFVNGTESLEECVLRELQEETAIQLSHLEQLYTYGAVGRDPRGRVLSVAYFGLVRKDAFSPRGGSDAKDAKWISWEDVNTCSFAFDHKTIIVDAINRLRSKLFYSPIGFELLPDVFLFSDLEKLYSKVLNRVIDRRNFRKKILSYGLLVETGKKISDGRGRPAMLYKFDVNKYRELEKIGFDFQIK